MRAIGAPAAQETRRGKIMVPGKDSVLAFLQEHVAPGEQILIYPYLPIYYYLTNTSNPTSYDYFQPGMHTTEQGAEMIGQLEKRPVRIVLLETSFAEKISNSWPGTRLAAIANDPIGAYLLDHYRTCQNLNTSAGWKLLVMSPKGSACP